MITLHSVSKRLGRGHTRRLILDNVTWTIQPRQHYVILGQQGAGKSTLLNIMTGSHLPSSGWVERKGTVCPGRTLSRVGSPGATPRQLSTQLARLYHVPPQEIVEFLPRFANLEGMMDVPIKSLPAAMQQRIGFALMYAIPFDAYLFDGDIGPRGNPFAAACQQAFEQRCKDAIAIVATSNPHVAKKYEGVGGILHEGKIYLFDTVSEAISAFRNLPRSETSQQFIESTEGGDDDLDDWL